MKLSAYIAALQKIQAAHPGTDLDMYVCHPGECCCGECFLPPDEYREVYEPTATVAYINGYSKPKRLVVIVNG